VPFAVRHVLILLAALAWSAPAAARIDATAEAESLFHRAQGYQRRHSPDARRQAMFCLERATLLRPGNAEYELALARCYYQMGFLKQAKGRFQRVERLEPDNADARMGLGIVWRRDYLKYLDRVSLRHSIEQLTEAARLRPDSPDPWLQLVPLLVEEPNLKAARAAAERAVEADPAKPEAMLALAHTSYRLGDVAGADSAFRRAIPGLPKLARDRFEDIAPLVSERDTMGWNKRTLAEREAFRNRFWKESDPDLTTPENEAQLEYWSRVTQAYFLFFDQHRKEWDQRGEVYVRYGPPEKADYNPVGAANVFRMGSYGLFPMNTLVWTYPELGMTVSMQDRLLSEYYLRPVSMVRDTDPIPDPDSLAAHGDRLVTRSGRGVFPKLPPGATPIPVDGMVARFESERAARVLGMVQTPGSPADSLWADWVVLDSAQVEVARTTRRVMSPSACDATEMRMADFAADLPPGEYTAAMSVRDARGGRGVFKTEMKVPATASTLALSDMVVSCGAPAVEEAADASPAVRLQADPAAHVPATGPLTVYFEMYHLLPGSDGLASIEFEYTVRSAERDRRIWLQRLLQPRKSVPAVSATRREEQPGTVRRQYVSIPISALPAGRYRVEIKVRDLRAVVERSASAEFVKEPPAGS
jgi:GWxTD domain-containing protein